MKRLLAPYRDVDRDALMQQFPGLQYINEVDGDHPEADPKITPPGLWLSGEFDDDDAPSGKDWVNAVAKVAADPTPILIANAAVVEEEIKAAFDDLGQVADSTGTLSGAQLSSAVQLMAQVLRQMVRARTGDYTGTK